MSGPYAEAAVEYLRSGWRGVLPITGKYPPPKGYTGADGPWPSAADVMSWADGPEGSWNIGLRLAEHVLGLDVDHYGAKSGHETLGDAEAVWGELPPTWVTTSRVGTPSGIRLFTVPPGLAWPGIAGAGVDVIQYRHRYAMVWPSVHPEGRRYEWIKPDGSVSDGVVPYADDLPMLPEKWVAGLTGGKLATNIAKIELAHSAVSAWLSAVGAGECCPVVLKALARAEALMPTDRHHTATDATHRLTMLAVEGHRGASAALGRLKAIFDAEVGAGRSGEWDRLLSGAVGIAATRVAQPLDPCTLVGGASYVHKAAPTLGDGRSIGLSQGATAAAPVPHLTVVPDALAREPERPAEPLAGPDPLTDPALALELAQQRARRQAKRILDIEEAPPLRVPPYVETLADELALPDSDVTYRINEILPTGGNVLFTAQYKSGKTTVINHLAKCLVDGDSFLGALPISEFDGRVTIFNYEVGRDQYRRWLRQVAIERPDKIAVLNLRGFALPLIHPAVTEWVIRYLAERDTRVWVLDPFARASMGSVTNENDNSEVGALLEHLDVIKSRAGVSELIIPAHTGRAEQEEGQERARGATRLDDWADVRWFLTKDEGNTRFFRATGRDVEYDEKELEYDEATRQLLVIGGNKTEARQRRVRNATLAVILNTPDLSAAQIEDGVRAVIGKADNNLIVRALRDLEKDNAITVIRQGPGKANLHRVRTKPLFGGVE